MIHVSVREDKIRVLGHANYAPLGKDIVCAAVSALTQNLIKSIESLTNDFIVYGMWSGRIEIEYENLSETSKTLIDSFFIGICAIVEGYPQYIEIV